MSTVQKVTFRGREDKARELARVFGGYLRGDILDVGCDAKHLSKLIDSHYVGADISDKGDVRINCEDGIPFRSRSFDTVLAMDVLEHCDQLHNLFPELCRVTRKHVIIGLPNMYEWHFRLQFLFGNRLSGKYGLPVDPPEDRHRWLLNLQEAIDFVRIQGHRNGFKICDEAHGYYSYNKLIPRIINIIGKTLGNSACRLFAYHYWVVLKRI